MRGTMIVSLDFELSWGMLDSKRYPTYQEHIAGGRRAIPELLKMFTDHGIHASWAVVGCMFADGYEDLKQYMPSEELRPTYEDSRFSAYHYMDLAAGNEETAPNFYAPSLIKKIAETKGQEIASHTFSHYYCREAGQTPDQFRNDLIAAKRIAAAKGYDLKTIVLPRNQCEEKYVQVMAEEGFLAYRDEEHDWIHEKIPNNLLKRGFRLMNAYLPLTGQGDYHPWVDHGVLNLAGSRMYRPIYERLEPLENLKIRRIKKQMLHAARKGLTIHLWWHPHNIGMRTEEHLKQLEEIFSYYDYLKKRYRMRSMNMLEAARAYRKY